MKVLHVITGISRKAGGPSRSSQGLVAGLCKAGMDAWIYPFDNADPWLPGVRKFTQTLSTQTLKHFDLVHLHGIWDRRLHRVSVMCRKAGVPYVIAPRGMLEPWSLKQKWLKKRIARWLYQDRDLKLAAALHATAESEAEQFRKLGFKNKIIVSPNGVNVPEGKLFDCSDCSIVRMDGTKRAKAERKVEEWLEGVTEKSFCAALERLVEEKSKAGEYRFRNDAERVAAIAGAVKFFGQFSRKIVQLSDGRCVYFVPDARAKNRNKDNAASWAEYAFHAVSNGGARIPGKGYNERLYNPHKAANFNLIEVTLKAERCYVRLDSDSRYDAIMFDGGVMSGLAFQVVARLDVCGNIEANLTEVTFTSSSKRVKKAPRLVALAEAVQAVVHHQTTPGSCPQDKDSISNRSPLRKGGHRALFVSRMHPKKGVLELVESWARVMKDERSVVPNRITENWFDVESPDVIRGLQTIRVSAAEVAIADRRAIKDVFRGFGSVENAADGRKVTFPSKSAGKMLGQRGVDLYRLAGSFAELFNRSRRAWSETEAVIDDHREHRNIGAYHQYIAKFNDGTDDCYIRFTVREERGTKNSRNEVHSSTVSRVTVYKAKGAELSNLGHAQAEDSTPFVDNKIAYFFIRVNPAWQCELVYTMNSEEERAYEQKVKDRIRELGMTYSEGDNSTVHLSPSPKSPDFIFTGPLDDEKKWDAYARADLFILPTYSENFGIVVAEALWAGVPVITTKGTPWAELECSASSKFQVPSSRLEERCGWWIDLPSAEVKVKGEGEGEEWVALDSALREAIEHSNTTLATLLRKATFGRWISRTILQEMGQRGHQLVLDRYTWSAVCGKMLRGYEELLK